MWVLQCSIYVLIILHLVNKVLGLEDIVLKKPLFFFFFPLPFLFM
jgi:hypothetical protein